MGVVEEHFSPNHSFASEKQEIYRSQSRAGFMPQSIEVMKYDGAMHLDHLNPELTTILEVTTAGMPSIEQNVNLQNHSNENQVNDDSVPITQTDTTDNCSLKGLSIVDNISTFPITETFLEDDRKPSDDKKPKNKKSKKITSQSQGVKHLSRRFPIADAVVEDDRRPNAVKKPKDKKTTKIGSQSQSVNHLKRPAHKFPLTAVLEDDGGPNSDKKTKDKKTIRISSQSQSVNRLSRSARSRTTSAV